MWPSGSATFSSWILIDKMYIYTVATVSAKVGEQA